MESRRPDSIARRAVDMPEDGTPDAGTGWWLHRGWWAVAAALIALLALVFSLVVLPSVGTSTPELAVPASSSGTTRPSPTDSAASPPTAPPESTDSPAPVSPQVSAPPLPGAGPSSSVIVAPSDPAPEEPSPTAPLTAGDIQLNDARFAAPEGWTLSGDEQIENDRRAVRLTQQETDVRLQAATLEPSGEALRSSCGALVDFQQTQFTDVKRHLVAPIGVDAGLGSAVRCGFEGIRASDGSPNTITFTLISRAVDSHVLMLRTTVPDQSADESPVVGQLNAMACGASTSFGVALPLC